MSEFKPLISCYRLLQSAGAIWLLSISQIGLAITVDQVTVRICPSLNYTCLIIESNQILKYKYFILNNPERLVLDIKDIKVNLSLKKIETQIYNNLYIRSAKVEHSNKQTVRITFTFKKNLTTHIFMLVPINKSKWYLIISIYPNNNIINNCFLSFLKNYNVNNLEQDILEILNKLQLDKNKTVHEKSILIMLDPGHGGEDSGAIGKYHTKEKDVVLQIARRLKILIDHEHNMHACMTRYNDVFIPLKLRVAKAQKQHADLFISIHTNAFTNSQPKGSSVFAFSTKDIGNIDIRYLVKIQNTIHFVNAVNKINNYYNNHVMFDIKQLLTIINSLKFGKAVLNKLAKVNKLHKDNVEQAEFVVLKTSNIPSILIEVAFISNIEEENKLKTAKFQQEIAESILAGIKSYLLENLMLAKYN